MSARASLGHNYGWNVTHPSVERVPPITTVAEYDGGPAVRISATQLGTRYSAHRAKKIVDEWCDFLTGSPTPILDLAFTTRTPKRLFACLRGQTQLEALRVKWGDYQDLSPLTGMHNLGSLWLGGASSVESLEPLSQLPRLRQLAVESLRRVRDLSPIGALKHLCSLELGGDWMSPRIAHVESISFVRELPHLGDR